MQLSEQVIAGERRAIARAITLVENELEGYESFLQSLPMRQVPVIGITGPPGAGKSTLISALLKKLTAATNGNGQPNHVAVIAVDPTSPFTHGSLLGDRLRMQEHFNNPQVFIRSLATRGALGGLSAKTIEICDVLRAAPFDYIFIETVGVGQSEVEIISLADTVVVTLVPEAGDEIQALKSGIMEIGDIFVVNKSDRDGADQFTAGIVRTLHERPAGEDGWVIPVLKTIAARGEGIDELITAITSHHGWAAGSGKYHLLAERAYRLIQHRRMHDISTAQLKEELEKEEDPSFNIYRFITKYV
jgi:LAO/AO transport system kinase